MGNPIDQQVIDFTTNYTHSSPGTINETTQLADIGIVTEQDTVTYMMELEDNFSLTYEDSDSAGILSVSDAIDLIKKKMGG
jgi:acyl carrier protein